MTAKKYKVGDIVRIRKDLVLNEWYDGVQWNSGKVSRWHNLVQICEKRDDHYLLSQKLYGTYIKLTDVMVSGKVSSWKDKLGI